MTRATLIELFGLPDRRTFAVRLWDGSVEGPTPGQAPQFTLVLRRPGALRRMLLPPSALALAEAYLCDEFDIEGDVEAAFDLVDVLGERLSSPTTLLRVVRLLRALPSDHVPAARNGRSRAVLPLFGPRHSRRRDAAAVRFHYDVGNDFYALWLDRRMVYSCAYFLTGTEDIDAAQTAKLEHICRKLRLEPGDHLLDIGCGWGGLVQYAAERYGVQAVGITLSEPQAALARERIAAARLGGRCRIDVRDYRDLPFGPVFDKIVSVGMMEHVGRDNLPHYFATAYRLMKPGGLFLNHGIVGFPARPATLARAVVNRLWRQGAFIQRYVFPGGELEPLGEVIRRAEAAGFETRDVESLREHYALTLRRWVRRLETRHAEAVAVAGEQAYRIWRLYMSGSAHAFATGRQGIAQVLFSKPDPTGVAGLPLTRPDVYRPAG